MATYPVHGMLEKEREAGAITTVNSVGDLTLDQSDGSASIDSVSATGNEVTLISSSEYVDPTTFYRNVSIGYDASNPLAYSPNEIAFIVDADYTNPVSPGGGELVCAMSPGAFDVFDAALSIFESKSAPKQWGALYWNAAKDLFQIEVGRQGGGAMRDLAFCAESVAKWKIAFSAGSHLLAAVDNTVNIGASGANRPAKIFLAPSNTLHSHLNLAPGTAPTTPVDGDIWFEASGLKIRIGGVTRSVNVT